MLTDFKASQSASWDQLLKHWDLVFASSPEALRTSWWAAVEHRHHSIKANYVSAFLVLETKIATDFNMTLVPCC